MLLNSAILVSCLRIEFAIKFFLIIIPFQNDTLQMNDKTIATHNGNFHADDVFSIAALKSIFPSFKLIRTRDLELIAKADLVIDVGGEYDADGIDAGLVSTIDAIDCGHVEGVSEGISLSQTISMFNPTWQEDSDFDAGFDEAVDFASRVLTRFIASANGGISAKAIVAEAIENAEDPRVIVLEKYTPWKKTVHALSEEALYMIYPSPTGQWRIQTVPVEPGSFEDKKSLPKQWAGLSGDELKEVTGIDDAMFCHNGLFIAGAESFESTVKMASMALND